MKRLLLVPVLVSASLLSHAQANKPKDVAADFEGFRANLRGNKWQKGTPGSFEDIVDGRAVRSLSSADGVLVMASVTPQGSSLSALILVENTGDAQILVEPTKFFVVTDAPSSRLLSYKQPSRAAGHSEGAARLAAFLSVFGAGMSHRSSTVQTSSGDRVIIQTPNDTAVSQAKQDAGDNIRAARSHNALVHELALKTNTLNKGQSVGGDVYFQRIKNLDHGTLHILIGNSDYQLPFDWSAKK